MTVQALGVFLQTINASNLSSLASYPSAQPGYYAYVSTLKCGFIANPSNTSMSDGYSVLDGYNVQWQRILGSSSDYWKTQNAWYIDGYVGNDENDGYTSLTPLKTADEIQRRYGGTNTVINQSTTYNILSDLDRFIINVTKGNQDVIFYIIGKTTTLLTSTVNTYTAPDTTNNKWTRLTSAGVSNWTNYVNNRIKFTISGVDSVSWIALQNPQGDGNNVAEINFPMTNPSISNNWDTPVNQTPINGTPFIVESLPTVNLMILDILDVNGERAINNILTYSTTYSLQSLHVKTLSDTAISNSYIGKIHWGCYLESFAYSSDDFKPYRYYSIGCLIASRDHNAATGDYIGCVFKSGVGGQTDTAFMGGTIIRASLFEGIMVYLDRGIVNLSQVGIFNSPKHALRLDTNGVTSNWLTYILGQGNAFYGFSFERPMCQVNINIGTIVKVTGASGDWRFNSSSTAHTWSEIPRAKNMGSTEVTLVNGTYSWSVNELPSDAIVTPTYKIISENPGILSYTKTTSSITVNSLSATDNSIIVIFWYSPTMEPGGIFSYTT